jgi:hypothetical protein
MSARSWASRTVNRRDARGLIRVSNKDQVSAREVTAGPNGIDNLLRHDLRQQADCNLKCLFVFSSSVEVAFKGHRLAPRWHRLLDVVVRVAC